MSFEVTGKLIEKYDVQTISEKFKKREFILEKRENSSGFEFIDYIKFQLTQDKCSLLDPYQLGDELKISFNLRGRKWEKEGRINYFTNLEAWRIEKLETDQQPPPDGNDPGEEPPMPDNDDFSSSPSSNQDFDDLPF